MPKDYPAINARRERINLELSNFVGANETLIQMLRVCRSQGIREQGFESVAPDCRGVSRDRSVYGQDDHVGEQIRDDHIMARTQDPGSPK